MAVLAHGGFGVAVDVEGVRNLSRAGVPVPDHQPHRGLGPGRGSGGGLRHADLERQRFKGFIVVCKIYTSLCPSAQQCSIHILRIL